MVPRTDLWVSAAGRLFWCTRVELRRMVRSGICLDLGASNHRQAHGDEKAQRLVRPETPVEISDWPFPSLRCVFFNLSITFFIGEYALAWVGASIVFLQASFLYFLLKAKLSRGLSESALKAHLVDFPGVACPPG